MKNKFFYNKFLPVLSVFLLIVFVFTTSVFASSDIKCQSCDFVIKTYLDYDFSSIRENGGKHLGLITAVNYNDEKYVVAYWSYDSNYHNVKPYLNNGIIFMEGTYNTMIYKVVDGSLVHQGWSGGLFEVNGFDDFGKNSTVFSSSSDIYTDSSLTDVFFHSAPLGITQTLVEETEKVQIAEQLRTMVVGFLKYLIALVISVIAFWKGWQFLLTQLKKA